MLSVYTQFHRAQEYHQNESNTSKWYHFDCVLGGSVIYSRVGSPQGFQKHLKGNYTENVFVGHVNAFGIFLVSLVMSVG